MGAMINSDPIADDSDARQGESLQAILRSGAKGGVALASLASAVVIALWFLFYLLVFVPRAVTP